MDDLQPDADWRASAGVDDKSGKSAPRELPPPPKGMLLAGSGTADDDTLKNVAELKTDPDKSDREKDPQEFSNEGPIPMYSTSTKTAAEHKKEKSKKESTRTAERVVSDAERELPSAVERLWISQRSRMEMDKEEKQLKEKKEKEQREKARREGREKGEASPPDTAKSSSSKSSAAIPSYEMPYKI